MWLSWKKSEVHNWTVEETVAWLVDSVELPQYVRLFHENQIDGAKLPRMAINSNHYLGSVLGIRDPIAKQRLVLKAMDVVLFGPQRNHNWLKDVVLAVVLIFATTIVWYLYRQNRRSQLQVQKMMKEMDSLQKAEDALVEMQQQLDKARSKQESLQEEISNKSKEGTAYSDPDNMIYKLQEEVRFLTDELVKAQNLPRGTVPPQLQHWLQLTHEIELKNYLGKKNAAEHQLHKAKDECEKLRRKGQSFMGPFRLTHGGSIDEIDTTILKARQALSEVTQDFTERLNRWRQIERLCGFNIVSNRGLVHLEALLHGHAVPPHAYNTPTAGSTKSVISRSGSEGTMSDDDSPGSYNNNMSSVNQLLRGSTAILLAPSIQHQCCLEADSKPQSGAVRPQTLERRRSKSSFPEVDVASTTSASISSKSNAVSHQGRRVGMQPLQPLQPVYPHEYFNQIESQQALLNHVTSPGPPPGAHSSLRREEPDGDLTPQACPNPVHFQMGGDGISPSRSEAISSFASGNSKLALMKGTSFDGSIDSPLEEDTNGNRIKNKRKGSKRRSAFMNAIRNSFTSASTLVDSEDNSSRGSTPALEDKRKKSGVFGAIKKISRGTKEKTTPERDS
ncbi:stromal interaction molecule homolog [Galendromus occidentalis]|uniref:Stromal interaction molecule homolog n=1 Tax=Galendromus occidentalis TaxID=34638 RepID=A0AAJ7WJ88_9ACAR|nr:stromal interaction molecule homolog [Galendromus occidentalis]